MHKRARSASFPLCTLPTPTLLFLFPPAMLSPPPRLLLRAVQEKAVCAHFNRFSEKSPEQIRGKCYRKAWFFDYARLPQIAAHYVTEAPAGEQVTPAVYAVRASNRSPAGKGERRYAERGGRGCRCGPGSAATAAATAAAR